MLSFLAPVLVFGLVIFVHELGHFLAAKAVGVYAPRFSIGFGPALIRFRRGETEYVLAALPLGGYVRMASKLDEEASFLEGGSETVAADAPKPDDWDPEAMMPFGPKPVPENRWFESKPLLARLFIMIAGVTMNAILTIVVASAVVYHLGRTIVPTTVVGGVTPVPSAPALAQLQTGDTVRAVDGKAVVTWNEVYDRISSGHGPLAIQTQRATIDIPAPADSDRANILAAITYFVPPVVRAVVAGERAEAAGIKSGDSIVAIDATPIRSWSDLAMHIGPAAERSLRFDIVREGKPLTVLIAPKAMKIPSASGKDSTAGKIGVEARDVSKKEPVGLGQAIAGGVDYAQSKALAVVDIVKQLATGGVSFRQLGGPIAITRASVTAARSGAEELFMLIAFLSINVAVINLLPIPILDGGQILINVIETVKGSPFTMRTREYILRFGLATIALLFLVVMFNDTRDGISKLVGWVFK